MEENLLETTGAGEAIFLAVTSLAAPGREVIVIEPSFVLFQPLVGLAGGSVRRIVTTAEKGYQVDPQEVIDAMGPRTCAVILNSPGNPTGAVYPASTVQAICQAAARRGITVISDEVYDRLVLDEMESPSVLNCDLDLDHLIVASSVSKTYSMPGMRVGWLISSRKNLKTLRRYHTYTTTVGNTPGQWASVAALQGDQSCVDRMGGVPEASRPHRGAAGGLPSPAGLPAAGGLLHHAFAARRAGRVPVRAQDAAGDPGLRHPGGHLRGILPQRPAAYAWTGSRPPVPGHGVDPSPSWVQSFGAPTSSDDPLGDLRCGGVGVPVGSSRALQSPSAPGSAVQSKLTP